jgi:hypothetical protein
MEDTGGAGRSAAAASRVGRAVTAAIQWTGRIHAHVPTGRGPRSAAIQRTGRIHAAVSGFPSGAGNSTAAPRNAPAAAIIRHVGDADYADTHSAERAGRCAAGAASNRPGSSCGGGVYAHVPSWGRRGSADRSPAGQTRSITCGSAGGASRGIHAHVREDVSGASAGASTNAAETGLIAVGGARRGIHAHV